MKRIASLAVALVAIAVPLIGAGGAAAAVEAGNTCLANLIYPSNSIVQLSRAAGSPLPIAAPSDGVVTKWKLTSGAVGVSAQILKVLRPTANPNAFGVVGESGYGAVIPGPNSFETRLPVQAGDRFGLSGVSGAVACQLGTGADKLGFTVENTSVGTTFTASAESPERQIPVSVVIERDADHDGYGDETQDNCPQNPAAHSECPLAAPAVVPVAETPAAKAPAPPAPLTIEALPQVRERSANVLVTASVKSSVVASGTVKLGKGKQAASRTATKIVDPGRMTPFTLKFPAAIRSKLKELSPKQSLTLKILVKATDSLGRPAQSRLKVKLPGQG
jgi:hypothetical protein